MLSQKYNQNFVKSKCVKIDDFLSLAENKKIIESVIKLEAYFQKSTTSLDLNNTNFCKSKYYQGLRTDTTSIEDK